MALQATAAKPKIRTDKVEAIKGGGNREAEVCQRLPAITAEADRCEGVRQGLEAAKKNRGRHKEEFVADFERSIRVRIYIMPSLCIKDRARPAPDPPIKSGCSAGFLPIR